ncbi:hypothetical protein NDU88_001241 [Pleurodeles waltl]|uniref:Uncharacterized protein n=1 Tax=Pleurodeles waltl TaxID=8319 RepID=A0AAV7S9K7_PLEWA|nr:hypothetical protein NDU88_001241 [Pleurodeles waltl]
MPEKKEITSTFLILWQAPKPGTNSKPEAEPEKRRICPTADTGREGYREREGGSNRTKPAPVMYVTSVRKSGTSGSGRKQGTGQKWAALPASRLLQCEEFPFPSLTNPQIAFHYYLLTRPVSAPRVTDQFITTAAVIVGQ